MGGGLPVIEIGSKGNFVIDLLPALEEEGLAFRFESQGIPVDEDGFDIEFEQPPTVRTDYVYIGGRLVLNGTLSCVIAGECDRCLKPEPVPLEIKLSETVFRGAPDDEDDESYVFFGEKAALDKIILDNIMLNMPQKILCKEDCKGLCPVCGIDLNENTCDCKIESDDNNPFSRLAGLFKDDEEV